MRFLTKPNDKVEDVFLKCISGFKNSDLQTRLQKCTETIVDDTKTLEDRICESQAHKVMQKDNVNGIVTADEMVKVYDQKFACKGAPGRIYYDKYLSAPHNGICPLCGVRIVSTLDHYMPKSKFPSLAVSPINLIPACRDCNTVKGSQAFSCSEDETLNPYFDVIDCCRWLFAKIEKGDPAMVTYYVIQPDGWDMLLYKRVKTHFREFRLNLLYSIHAAEEISNMEYRLSRLFIKCGSQGVKEQLIEEYESCAHVSLNSWRTALYDALKDSEWFCSKWSK